jgi:hypothetical protein
MPVLGPPASKAGLSPQAADKERKARPWKGGSPATELSNDYLNHYSEALMLIELASSQPECLSDLMDWRPLDYRAYFAASPLRRADAALAAYEALPEERRAAFDALTGAMDKLAMSAILALQPPCAGTRAALVAELTLPAFHGLIGRAASFLNSGGRDLGAGGEVEQAQAAVDRLLDRTGTADPVRERGLGISPQTCYGLGGSQSFETLLP